MNKESPNHEPERRPTFVDIAKQAGVCKATVSLALRNNSRISADMRKRIQDIAVELGPFGIRVNCLEPGATFTELTKPQYTPEIRAALFERVPLKKIAEAEWIANGALFLASDESCYMTGETLVLDGGYINNGKLAGVTYPDE